MTLLFALFIGAIVGPCGVALAFLLFLRFDDLFEARRKRWYERELAPGREAIELLGMVEMQKLDIFAPGAESDWGVYRGDSECLGEGLTPLEAMRAARPNSLAAQEVND